MITHIRDYLAKTIPPADICIVGAGAAGLELALSLRNSSLSILLLESGNEDFDWHVQKLCRFKQIGRPISTADHSRFFGLEEARKKEIRIRQFGGTLNAWSRRWKPLDPIDFQQKPYLQESGWPLTFEDLHPYYLAVAQEHDVLEVMQLREKQFSMPLLPNDQLITTVSLKQLIPTDIRHQFYNPIANDSTIRLVLGANVVNIVLSNDLQQVDHLMVRSLEGQEWKVQARQFILACGSIENARLLLISNKQIEAGVGNQTGWVGRNFIDHLKGTAGFLMIMPHHKFFQEADQYFAGKDKVVNFDLMIHPGLLEKWHLPNHSIRLKKFLYNGIIYRKIQFFLEQLPNPDSRMFLSEELDELNLPISCLDWKIRELDISGFKGFVEKLNELLISHNIGRLMLDESCYDMRFLFDSSHQMGTTRMAADPTDGVVDRNCKVFGMDNLYLLGSSVFPSGGSANPTFTILALAKRLAHHLRSGP